MKTNDLIHLEWIHNRLIDVYGESRNVDFVIKLREIINEANSEVKASNEPMPRVSKKALRLFRVIWRNWILPFTITIIAIVILLFVLQFIPKGIFATEFFTGWCGCLVWKITSKHYAI